MKIAFTFLFALISLTWPKSTVDIPLDHPVYRDFPLFLDIPRQLPFDPWMRPCSKANVLLLLETVSSDSSSPWQTLAKEYLNEFQSPKKLFAVPFAAKGDSFAFYPVVDFEIAVQDSHFNRDGIQTLGDLDTGKVALEAMGPNTEMMGRVLTGVSAGGTVGNLALYFKGGIITRYTSLEAWPKTNDPRRGIMLSNIFEKQDVPGHLVGYEEFVAYGNISTSIADFKLGRDGVQWGESEKQGLFFSGEATPFLQMRATRTLGPIDVQMLVGKLTSDTYDESRLVYAKRIGWRPMNWLTLGFNDEVITINRGLEPYYFIPVLPFYFAEHFVGDLDNRLMGFDAAVQRGRFTFYTQFLMDDMRNLVGVFNDSDVSNKWGVLAGLRMNRSPWPKLLSSATLEFAQIEPWVYTSSARNHYDTVWTTDDATGFAKFTTKEIYNYPVHFGRLLGNGLGPNTRTLSLRAVSRFMPRLKSEVEFELIWKGSGPGSAVTDRNPTVVDTTASSGYNYRFQGKQNIRFNNYAIDRFIASASLDWDPKPWYRMEVGLVLIHETATPLNGNYFQFRIKNSLNF